MKFMLYKQFRAFFSNQPKSVENWIHFIFEKFFFTSDHLVDCRHTIHLFALSKVLKISMKTIVFCRCCCCCRKLHVFTMKPICNKHVHFASDSIPWPCSNKLLEIAEWVSLQMKCISTRYEIGFGTKVLSRSSSIM